MAQLADRLEGPSMNRVASCGALKDKLDKQHDLIILSNLNSSTHQQQLQKESLADAHKSQYWFYHIDKTCKGLVAREGVHLLKIHLNRALTFEAPPDAASPEEVSQSMLAWIAMRKKHRKQD